MRKEIKKDRLKVFIEDARLVQETELADLPPEKRDAVAGKKGLWIEVACPGGACAFEGEKIILPAGGVVAKEARGIWLSLFCPENQCVVEQSTDLP